MTCPVHSGLASGQLLALNAAKVDPGKVPAEVLSYLARRGVKGSFDFRDVWKEEHAAAFAVAKAVELDVVQSMKDAVHQALAEGLPLKAFQKRLTPILADQGWWGRKTQVDPITGEEREVQLGSPHRLRIIYDTNVRVARAAGQWERIQGAKKALPYLRYRHGNPQRARPDHESWDGRVLPVDHPFWDVAYPPNGYLCTCWVEQITSKDAKASGVTPDEDLDMTPIEVRNPRTGVTTTTIRGVDPTFAFNAGKARLEGLRQAGVIKSKPKAKPDAGLAIVRATAAPSTWSEVVDLARRVVRVAGGLSEDALAALTALRVPNAPEDAADQLRALGTKR